MKKAVSLFMALVLLLSMNTVRLFAADTWGGYTVVASQANAEVGDIVDVTVYLDDCSALSGGVYNVNFFIDLSDGLEFVSGSAEIDADAFEASTGMEKLAFNEAGREGVPYTVWALGALTQGYNGGKVEIISFECKVAAEGTQTITLTSPELTDVAGTGKLANVTPATIEAKEKHVHNYGDTWQYDATNHYKACACGEWAEVGAHDMKWIVDKEPSYTEKGEGHYECFCGYKKGEGTSIDKLSCDGNHSVTGTWHTDADNHWKVCDDCGEAVNVAPHTFDWVVDSDSTCSQTGVKHEECSCGYKRNENTAIDKKAHDFQWVIDKEATTEETGIKHEECTVCHEKRNEGTVIPKKESELEGHEHVYGHLGMDEKYHWVYCNCGEIGNKGEHKFADAANGMVRCTECGYETAKSAGNPQTGDNSNLGLWLAFMAIAAGAVSVVVYKKKKQM